MIYYINTDLVTKEDTRGMIADYKKLEYISHILQGNHLFIDTDNKYIFKLGTFNKSNLNHFKTLIVMFPKLNILHIIKTLKMDNKTLEQIINYNASCIRDLSKMKADIYKSRDEGLLLFGANCIIKKHINLNEYY